MDSALARFLLRRALAKPRLIGHIYFWLLQSEVYNADVSKRYVILLQVGACTFVCLKICWLCMWPIGYICSSLSDLHLPLILNILSQ